MIGENLKYEFTADTQQFISGVDGMIGKLKGVLTGADAASAGVTAFGKAANDTGAQLGYLQSRAADVESSVQSMGKYVRMALMPISTIAGAAALGITAFTIATAKSEETLRKLGQTTLASRRSLREFTIISAGTGVEMKDIASGIDKAHDAVRGITKPTDDAAVNFKFLGLNLKELRSMSPDEQFRTIADAILALKDPTTAADLAMATFGMSLKDLRAIADDSGSKLKDLSVAQAELVTTQETSTSAFESLNAKAREFRDACDDAVAGATSLGVKISGYLMPIFDWAISKATQVARAISDMFASMNASFASAAAAGSTIAVPGGSSGKVSNPSDDLPGVAPDDSPRKMEKPTAQAKEVASAKEVARATSFTSAELKGQLSTIGSIDAAQKKTAADRVKAGDAEAKRLKSMRKAAEDAESGGGGGKGKKEGKSDDEKELDKLKKEAEALNDLYLPMEKLNKQTEKFNELFNKGLISAGVRDQAIAKATEDAEKRMKELNKSTDMAGKFMDDLKEKTKSWSDSLIDGIVDGKKSFGEMISSMMKDVAKMALKSAINPFMESLTGGKGKMGGSAKSPLPGAQGPSMSMLGGIGKRASGGAADGLTLVGERGPELAMFGSGGGYVANASDTQRMMDQKAGGTNISNITVNVPQGTTPDQGAKIAKYMDAALEERIRKSQRMQQRRSPMRG